MSRETGLVSNRHTEMCFNLVLQEIVGVPLGTFHGGGGA